MCCGGGPFFYVLYLSGALFLISIPFHLAWTGLAIYRARKRDFRNQFAFSLIVALLAQLFTVNLAGGRAGDFQGFDLIHGSLTLYCGVCTGLFLRDDENRLQLKSKWPHLVAFGVPLAISLIYFIRRLIALYR